LLPTVLTLLRAGHSLPATAPPVKATEEPLKGFFPSKLNRIVPFKGITLTGKKTIVPLEKFSVSKKAMTVLSGTASLTGMPITVSQKGSSL
jgi:hypothetical protein